MDLTQLANLGEFIGGVAVLVTLVYLALQTNRAGVASEAGNTLSTVTLHSRWRAAMLQNDTLAAIAAKANRGEPLNPEEAIQFHVLCDELFIAASVTYANGVRSGALHDTTGDIQYLVNLLRLMPGAVSEWERAREVTAAVSQEFVEIVDNRLAASRV